jgi:hypothetical protein
MSFVHVLCLYGRIQASMSVILDTALTSLTRSPRIGRYSPGLSESGNPNVCDIASYTGAKTTGALDGGHTQVNMLEEAMENTKEKAEREQK